MLTEKFYEVINKEGVVSIVSNGTPKANIVNTWNSYLKVTEDEKILIPAAGMRTLEENIKTDNSVQLTLGSKEVNGLFGPGAGFLIEGFAKFIEEGPIFDMMKENFPFLSRVLEITVTHIKQTV